jgi:hypothetical protein
VRNPSPIFGVVLSRRHTADAGGNAAGGMVEREMPSQLFSSELEQKKTGLVPESSSASESSFEVDEVLKPSQNSSH